ncbi:hypothetical protein DPMN_136955 [Dreissena polymorpha]|uniref:Uncharacterized protein n=1 Tax=Dreissena polymorpha TaxID=45954 RepID=A0A9D4G103_DREPO|nr:hypothetical protein DPMN_136955 [Dreissena polymorpha]
MVARSADRSIPRNTVRAIVVTHYNPEGDNARVREYDEDSATIRRRQCDKSMATMR